MSKDAHKDDGVKPVSLIPVNLSLQAYSGNNTGKTYSPTDIYCKFIAPQVYNVK
jgi:hypothetical protein